MYDFLKEYHQLVVKSNATAKRLQKANDWLQIVFSFCTFYDLLKVQSISKRYYDKIAKYFTKIEVGFLYKEITRNYNHSESNISKRWQQIKGLQYHTEGLSDIILMLTTRFNKTYGNTIQWDEKKWGHKLNLIYYQIFEVIRRYYPRIGKMSTVFQAIYKRIGDYMAAAKHDKELIVDL